MLGTPNRLVLLLTLNAPAADFYDGVRISGLHQQRSRFRKMLADRTDDVALYRSFQSICPRRKSFAAQPREIDFPNGMIRGGAQQQLLGGRSRRIDSRVD